MAMLLSLKVLLCAPTVLAGATLGPASLAARPVRLSDVELKGTWADAQSHDREVLMSLNMSRFACHFTTTANLTSCEASEVLWQTYLKDNASTGGFRHSVGFLGAGDDLKAAESLPLAECQRVCKESKACLAFTFQDGKDEPLHPVRCYWKTAVHFTPENARGSCIASGGAGMPPCEPLPGEMGLGGYYGHYQGHWLSATAFLINNTGDEAVRKKASGVVDTFAKVMDAWKAKCGYDGYLFPYDPLVYDKLLAGRGAGPYYSVPFYTTHKIMAGLLDQYVFAGNLLAFDLVKRMAGWTHQVVEATLASGGEELWQKVLLTEWGGMNDVLFNLYDHTQDPRHLATARRFNGYVFTAPLAEGRDNLADLPFPHANFHLPEIIGNARAYELTGNTTDATITKVFFEALTSNHSYCTGGSNSGECWQQPRDLGAFLSDQTEESCTQYNVLKIARHLFQWSADSSYADFYERAILNGIIGNQDRSAAGPTSYIYMLPLGGSHKKPWGKSDYGFPCCWGTLSESFAKLGDSIYFTSATSDSLYVNQFVSSKVTLQELGATVEQVSEFPSSPEWTTRITVRLLGNRASGADFMLKIRVPRWLHLPGRIVVNGAEQSKPVPGTYYEVARHWADGDTVDVSFPMSLWTDPLNDYHADYNATMAFMFGPLVLAGVNVTSDIFVPKGDEFRQNPGSFIQRVSDTALQFEASAADGGKMAMVPLKDVLHEQYAVYFMTAGTKPAQPKVVYCPHSQDIKGHDAGSGGMGHGCHGDDDSELVSVGPPLPSPVATASGHGVKWGLADGMFSTYV
eukprot:TRINITY_DN20809_c0_g1_i1.p1 TRINITY_DN20809_c0_g1~~TRINITY_DN20809_c0_g1_i1.p1  ORF type:complete len:809 (+),score=167.38 TRINITY_DN20809_c0_g1_i1:31-2427(+)